ncbi:MAG: sigma-70 family RNA polymerase sigma factor [Chitinophagales bacterium]
MSESNKITGANLLQQIKIGNRTVLNQLYETYRAEFIHWTRRKFNCKEADSIDVFQETIIAFYENVVNNKIIEFQSSVKTYLFAIGRNILLKRFRNEKGKTEELEVLQNVADGLQIDDSIQLSERQEAIVQLLEKLGEPCKTLLQLFYYQQFSVEAIVTAMEYKNESVVKNQKVRCIKRLRTMAADLYEQDEL